MFKGLTEGYRSRYDPGFVYRVKGWTVHPNPDTVSKEACGRGLHLCKRLIDVPSFVNGVQDVFWCRYRGTLGEDTDKVRAREVLLVRVCPWAKLNTLYDDYQAKRNTLYDAYQAKRKPLDAAYEAKLQPLDAAYQAKRKPLYAAYQAKRKPLDAAYQAKRKPLYDDYQAKRKTLYDAYERNMRKKFREEAQLV